MSYQAITYEVDDPVALITLNRPEALNAWVPRMDHEIRDAIGRAASGRGGAAPSVSAGAIVMMAAKMQDCRSTNVVVRAR